MILIDTVVLIDILRGHRPARDWCDGLTQRPACSEITRTEVLRAMRSTERSRTLRLLGTVGWIGVDDAVSRRAGELGRQFRRSHGLIGVGDLLIAATALECGADLATRNVRQFPMFAGLAAPY